jgi:uncharacterized OB-fold protein
MSLVECKVCGEKHAKIAKVCPHCGNTQTPQAMSQAIAGLVLAVIIIAGFFLFSDEIANWFVS